jgi:hypothetical protein
MKTVCALMLSCFAVVSAVAGDSTEMLRHRLIVHDQFVIEEPDPLLMEDSMRCCCRLADRCDHRAVYDQVRAHR